MTNAASLWHKREVFAVWLHHLDPFVFQFNGIGPRWYGLSYVLSALAGYWLYCWLAKRGYTDLAVAKVADFITWIGLFGVLLGGRIGWIVFYGWGEIHDTPWWWLQVWKGGMASHGGILGIVVVTFILSRRWKVSWTSIGDSLCVVAPVGLFLVRCANFINGELYGHETHAAWAVQFPTEMNDSRFAPVADRAYAALEPQWETIAKYGDPKSGWIDQTIEAARHEPAVRATLATVLTPRHPSQLYEAFLEGVLLFAVLWLVRTRCRVPRGMLTGLFFILYAIARITGEVFRVPDPAWSVSGLSPGQFLSLFMFGIGAAFIVWSQKTRQFERADSSA